jgi:hypothetical protein
MWSSSDYGVRLLVFNERKPSRKMTLLFNKGTVQYASVILNSDLWFQLRVITLLKASCCRVKKM